MNKYLITSILFLFCATSIARSDCRIEHKQTRLCTALHHHIRYSNRPGVDGKILSDQLIAWDTFEEDGAIQYHPVDFCGTHHIESINKVGDSYVILMKNGNVIQSKYFMETSGTFDPMRIGNVTLRYRRLLP